jgi:hypothetical protein
MHYPGSENRAENLLLHEGSFQQVNCAKALLYRTMFRSGRAAILSRQLRGNGG